MSFKHLADNLNERGRLNLLRKRVTVEARQGALIQIDGQHYLNFSSNDYLGLSQHIDVLQAYADGLSAYGASSSASSVVCGYSVEHQSLEDELCTRLNKPAVALFSSGVAANQAVCDALFPTYQGASFHSIEGEIICDKFMHASFIQGALHSSAKLKRFKHNDIAHAKSYLQNAAANCLVATEGVFSMDGDTGNVASLMELLANESLSNRPWLMIDDAHAIGVLGQNGFGSADTSGIDASHIDIIMGTFGKAVGTSGAFVAGSKRLIDYLINNAKHYVYSTAVSAAQAKATRCALGLIDKGVERSALHENIALFRQLCANKNIPLMPSDSAIQGIIIGDPSGALLVSKRLADLGIWIPAIRTPTVPKNTDRLRITLSAIHHRKDIEALVDALYISLTETCLAGSCLLEKHAQTSGVAK